MKRLRSKTASSKIRTWTCKERCTLSCSQRSLITIHTWLKYSTTRDCSTRRAALHKHSFRRNDCSDSTWLRRMSFYIWRIRARGSGNKLSSFAPNESLASSSESMVHKLIAGAWLESRRWCMVGRGCSCRTASYSTEDASVDFLSTFPVAEARQQTKDFRFSFEFLNSILDWAVKKSISCRAQKREGRKDRCCFCCFWRAITVKCGGGNSAV